MRLRVQHPPAAQHPATTNSHVGEDAPHVLERLRRPKALHLVDPAGADFLNALGAAVPVGRPAAAAVRLEAPEDLPRVVPVPLLPRDLFLSLVLVLVFVIGIGLIFLENWIDS